MIRRSRALLILSFVSTQASGCRHVPSRVPRVLLVNSAWILRPKPVTPPPRVASARRIPRLGLMSRQPSRLAPATRSTPPVFSCRCRSESTTAERPSSPVPRPKPHVRPSPLHSPSTRHVLLGLHHASSTVSCDSCTPQADRHGCTHGFRHRVSHKPKLLMSYLDNHSS